MYLYQDVLFRRVDKRTIDKIIKDAEPALRLMAECSKRNHRDREGALCPRELVIDRGGSGDDLYYCQNCKMPYSERPSYAKTKKFYDSLQERITI